MSASQQLRAAFRFDNLQYTPVQDAFVVPTYLWTIFFTIDGQEAYVDDSNSLNIHLAGSAYIGGNIGGHGDLGDSAKPGIITIPRDIGEYRNRLLPFPLKSNPSAAPIPAAIFGSIVILMGQEDTPSDAIFEGYLTLRTALVTALNSVIPTLGIQKQAPTPLELQNIQYYVLTSVKNAIANNVSFWDAFAGLFAGGQDFTIGLVPFYFSQGNLQQVAPSGSPLQYQFTYPPSTPLSSVWQLNGRIFADPWNFSLRRSLQSQGLEPAKGVHKPLLAASVSSVRTWIRQTSPTW